MVYYTSQNENRNLEGASGVGSYRVSFSMKIFGRSTSNCNVTVMSYLCGNMYIGKHTGLN